MRDDGWLHGDEGNRQPAQAGRGSLQGGPIRVDGACRAPWRWGGMLCAVPEPHPQTPQSAAKRDAAHGSLHAVAPQSRTHANRRLAQRPAAVEDPQRPAQPLSPHGDLAVGIHHGV